MKVEYRCSWVLLAALISSTVLFSVGNLSLAQSSQVNITPRMKAGSADRASSDIRVDSDLVLVPVMVTDPEDRSVTGLERGSFKLFEDRVEQPITHFASEDAPVTVGIIFDCSGSMGPKLRESRAAVSRFLGTANAKDEFFLVAFSGSANLVVDLTDRGEEIQSRLSFTQSAGRTALLDAVYLGLAQMKRAKNPRTALLIVSDGGDNSSRYTEREVKQRVRESDVQIYSVGIVEPLVGRGRSPEEFAGPELLQDISRDSGGRFFEVTDTNELPAVASKIGTLLRNQYLIGYSPGAPSKDGKFHRIEVKLARPKGVPPLRAFFRRGYFAPAD
jgi:Ca-activated chloride channel family protein